MNFEVVMVKCSGMPVCEALTYVEQHRALFDVVHVKYDDEVRCTVFADFS